jgi:hypothetical protein
MQRRQGGHCQKKTNPGNNRNEYLKENNREKNRACKKAGIGITL